MCFNWSNPFRPCVWGAALPPARQHKVNHNWSSASNREFAVNLSQADTKAERLLCLLHINSKTKWGGCATDWRKQNVNHIFSRVSFLCFGLIGFTSSNFFCLLCHHLSSSFFIYSSHTFSTSFVQLAPLAPSPPCRPSFCLCPPIFHLLLCNEIQMSLLDLSVPHWDQKTAATLLKTTLFLSLLSLRQLISQFLVNLITLIPGDIAGNFYAKCVRTYERVCSFSRSWQIRVTCRSYRSTSWTETKLFISLRTPLSVSCSLSAFSNIHYFSFVLSFLPLSSDHPSPSLSSAHNIAAFIFMF